MQLAGQQWFNRHILARHLMTSSVMRRFTSGSNSAVPTVMLVATSLLDALIYCTEGILIILIILHRSRDAAHFTSEMQTVAMKSAFVANVLIDVVFAYNCYVHLITDKQFRAELRKLLCCCLPSSSAVAATP